MGVARLLAAGWLFAIAMAPQQIAAQRLGLGRTVFVAADPALELEVVVERIVERTDDKGELRRELVPVDAVAPRVGDADVVDMPIVAPEVVLTILFANVSQERLASVRITHAIPPALRYVADTAAGPGSDVLYSVDGGQTYGLASELFVAEKDGSRREAGASDYTNLRWLLKSSLDPGAKGQVRYRAIAPHAVEPEPGLETPDSSPPPAI